MADVIDNLKERIALVRRNIGDLTEQATGASGAASEERIASRMSDQQDILNELLQQQEGVQSPGLSEGRSRYPLSAELPG